MTGRKEFEMLFKLSAALGPNFQSTFKTSIETVKKLQGSMQDLKKTSEKIDSFKKQTDALQKSKDKLSELYKEQKRLNDLLKNAPDGSEEAKKYQEQLDKNKSSIDKVNQSIHDQTQKLSGLQTELKKSGIDTNNLTAENDKLKKAYDNLKESQEKIAEITAKQDKLKESISATKTEIVKTVGAIAGVGTALYKGAIEPAMEFESAFAGVKKTVDWGDDADKAIQKQNEVKQSIREMAREIPASVTEISAVAEAAGQLGIASENLTSFSKVMLDLGQSTNLTSDAAADSLLREEYRREA